MAGLGVDADGLLWVFVRVPAPTWKSAWAGVAPGAREVSTRQLDIARLYHTRVEVIDPREGRVLARTDIPGLVISPMGNGRVGVWSATLSGDAQLRIDQLRLTRPR